MRLVHYVITGSSAGGVERYVAALLADERPGLEHAVVTHASGPAPIAGRWPVTHVPWLAGEARRPAPPSVPRGVAVFHSAPAPESVRAVRSAGDAVVVFCHGHEHWCPSGSRYHAHVRRRCRITAGAGACLLRYHALGCGSLRPLAARSGFRRAAAGRAALQAADAVLVASHHMRDEAIRHGAAPSKVHLVPLPITVGAGGPDGAGRSSGPARILCASRLTPLKGVGALLAAFARVRAEAVLEFAGSGNAEAALRRAAAGHPRAGSIVFAGALEGAALAAAFARADVVAVPSLWPEPFGLVGIEALAAGRPVVASGSGGMADWACASRGVLVAPPEDPAAFAAELDRALTEPEWRGRAATTGREWALAHHGLAAHAEALLRALGPLAGEPAGR